MRSKKTDNAVCLMDIPDDFGKDDPDLYEKTYDAAIAFAKEFPDTLWCYGNHDLSYVWGKLETGYNPELRDLVCQKIEELKEVLPSPTQLAYIHRIDKTLFMHGGLSNFYVHRWVTPSSQKAIGRTIKEINNMYGFCTSKQFTGGHDDCARLYAISNDRKKRQENYQR